MNKKDLKWLFIFKRTFYWGFIFIFRTHDNERIWAPFQWMLLDLEVRRHKKYSTFNYFVYFKPILVNNSLLSGNKAFNSFRNVGSICFYLAIHYLSSYHICFVSLIAYRMNSKIISYCTIYDSAALCEFSYFPWIITLLQRPKADTSRCNRINKWGIKPYVDSGNNNSYRSSI